MIRRTNNEREKKLLRYVGILNGGEVWRELVMEEFEEFMVLGKRSRVKCRGVNRASSTISRLYFRGAKPSTFIERGLFSSTGYLSKHSAHWFRNPPQSHSCLCHTGSDNRSGALFWSSDVEKFHAAVAKSAFWNENVQNTSAADSFLKFWCRKISQVSQLVGLSISQLVRQSASQ